MKDRRRDFRIIEENRVVVSLMRDGAKPSAPGIYHSLTRDISVGGLRIMTAAPLEVGERVRLDISLRRSRRQLLAAAEVRWVRELYAGEVKEAGLQFIGLDPAAEFALMEHIFGDKDKREA